MSTKEGSTKFVNLMTPGVGVLMLGHGHISHYSDYDYVVSSTLSTYSTLIAIMLRDYDAAFLYHRWFPFIPWWGCCQIQILAPLTRSQCKVSDTQVTVKACGPLVIVLSSFVQRCWYVTIFFFNNFYSYSFILYPFIWFC